MTPPSTAAQLLRDNIGRILAARAEAVSGISSPSVAGQRFVFTELDQQTAGERSPHTLTALRRAAETVIYYVGTFCVMVLLAQSCFHY